MVFKSILVIILDGFQHVFCFLYLSYWTLVCEDVDFYNDCMSLFGDVLSAFLNTVWHCIDLVEGN